MEYVIDKLKSENIAILRSKPYLQIFGDWTEECKKLFANDVQIEKLNKLPIRLAIGSCSCGHRIVRDDVIKYCAYCHKQIDD